MGIEVGSKVRCKSRIFGETWAKEKYGVGPGGWTTQWEKGVVIEAVSRHFWKVKFSDDAEMEISSQNLRLLSADTVLDYDSADEPDDDYDDAATDLADCDEERIATESDGSDSDDDTPLSVIRHHGRTGKEVSWHPPASNPASGPNHAEELKWTVGEVTTDAARSLIESTFPATIFPGLTGVVTAMKAYTTFNPEYVHFDKYAGWRNMKGREIFGEKWIDITLPRLKVFDGLILSMTLAGNSNMRGYWATKPRGANPSADFGRFMSVHEFEMIRKVQSILYDPAVERHEADSWYKADGFVKDFNMIRVKEVIPAADIIIDETMLIDECEEDPTAKVSPSFIAFVARKPHARGIELKDAADTASGVLLRVEIVKVIQHDRHPKY